MTTALDHLRSTVAQTDSQRQALRVRAAQTVDRFAAPRLAEDAVDFAADLVSETGQQIRAHPITFAGVVAAAGLYLFRRPIGARIDALLDRVDPPADAAAHSADIDYTEPDRPD